MAGTAASAAQTKGKLTGRLITGPVSTPLIRDDMRCGFAVYGEQIGAAKNVESRARGIERETAGCCRNRGRLGCGLPLLRYLVLTSQSAIST